MKYKVGDKVLIRSDLKLYEIYGCNSITQDMMEFVGKICTIQDVNEEDYNLVEDPKNYFWTDEMIECRVGISMISTPITCQTELNMSSRFLSVDIATKADICTASSANYVLWKGSSSKEDKYMNIEQIKIIVPNKVVEVYFTDGLKEKMICHEDDTFDLRNCLFLAFAKHMYKDTFTVEGIEYKANEMKFMKKYVKLVDVALKKHKNAEAAAEKAKAEEERVKATAERKKAKLAKYKARCKEKYRQKRIAEQTEAYVNAMMLYDQIMCGCEDCNCTLERTCGADCSDDLK